MSQAPGWRLRIDHVTTFEYSSAARASYNEVRQIPITTTRQTTLEAKVTTVPPAPQYSYRDYWGTQVVAFNVDAPHERLSIHGSSLVDTHPQRPVADVTWDSVAAARPRLVEFVEPSRYTDASPELTEVAETLWAPTPAATVDAVVEWVRNSLDYVQGVTHVHTSAVEAFGAGRGVCQDFAHLALTMLRAVGLPAVYVSGYLHPDTDAEVGAEAIGQSHAWTEVWLGNWWGLDPTNGTEIGLRHVVVARGRDYADVSPVRGVYAGGAEHEPKVTVRVKRTV